MSVRCIALLGSGLDGQLAIALMQQQGIEVVAATLKTVFTTQAAAVTKAAEHLKVTLEVIEADAEYFERVRHPRFGYSREMAPCLDCRVLMLKAVERILARHAASFIVTGDVVGQRLPGQSKRDLALVDFHAGVEGKVLRPLSALLLAATDMEQEGTVDRARLMNCQGRSRQRQHRLAGELGWNDLPATTSGCLLADAAFAHRTRNLLARNPAAPPEQFALLRLGRHYRHRGTSTIIVGRNATENGELAEWFTQHGATEDLLMVPTGFIGPTALAMCRTADATATVAQLIWKHRKLEVESPSHACFEVQGVGSEARSLTMSVSDLAMLDESSLVRL